MNNADDLEQRPGESLEDYIMRLEQMPAGDTDPLDAGQRKRLRDALNLARDAKRRRRL